MDAAERLIELYNELDRLLRDSEGDAEHYVPFTRRVQQLSRENELIKRYRDDLLLMADLRNLLVHETYIDSINPVFQPHIRLVQRFEDILQELLRPHAALDYAVPAERIYKAGMRDPVLQVIHQVYKRGFSHVPVVEDGRIVGVFSESAVFAMLAEGGTQSLTADLKVEDLQAVMSLARYKADRYQFIPPETPVFDAAAIFAQTVERGRRVAVVFITDNGKQDGRLLGMLTLLDISRALGVVGKRKPTVK